MNMYRINSSRLERLRNVEFSRDWGLPILTVSGRLTENIISATAGLKNEKSHSFTYQFTNYHRSDNYNGFKTQYYTI